MMCPRCQSVFLLVKERKGFERIRIALTGKRTYECTDCNKVFRIKDRRRFDRQANPNWDSEKEHEHLVGGLQHGQRYTCIVSPVGVHSGDISEPFAAVILDVSRSGLRIQAPRRLSIRDQVNISVHGEKEKPVIHAEVRFCRPNLDGGTYDIGLRIIDTINNTP
jgi:PilZ domain